ncbi:nuclear transport factor 2 family protein [Mycolicibacterium vinylchloridicum]|uniref:nuclear transport factor 2 family protein n=1 Tax=Mycolicibacterium vinylchloridicum TaxID=2736928 RepID=UPI0015C6D262|nr:nuclear transport factor 2 family protein [Mycolicibacterium vinylchloridicum]
MTSTSRSAREVVELYNHVVWGQRDFALADELMGDTVIRHEVGEAVVQTHEQAVQRIVDSLAMFEEMSFTLKVVVDDGEYVAVVYESPMRFSDGTDMTISSIEVFRVVLGRITEVWNSDYKQGTWH